MNPKQQDPASRSTPVIGLIFSLSLHLGLLMFILFDLPACVYELAPEAIVAALKPEDPAAAAPAPPEVVTVDLFGEVPWLTEAAEQQPEAAEQQPKPAPPIDDTPGDSAPDPEAVALGPKSQDLPKPELKKRGAPPEVKAPEIEKPVEKKPEPTRQAKAEPKKNNGPVPLHEIITRSLGRDAANRMVGHSGGRDNDPEIQKYVKKVMAKFRSNTEPFAMVRPKKMATRFSIMVEPNGRINGYRLNSSSGDAAFDQAARNAVMKSSPLPPLPASFGGRPWMADFTFYSDDKQ